METLTNSLFAVQLSFTIFASIAAFFILIFVAFLFIAAFVSLFIFKPASASASTVPFFFTCSFLPLSPFVFNFLWENSEDLKEIFYPSADGSETWLTSEYI